MKCVVKGCTNYSHEGVFVGLICGPCHQMLVTGKYNPSNAWFIQEIDSLRTQFADCRVRHEMQRIENDKLLDELNSYRLNKENTTNVFLEAENSKLQDDICILERNIVNLASDKAFLARCLRLAHETIDQYRDKLGDVYK